MAIKKHVIKTMEATQMGITFMITAHMTRLQIMNNTGGTETDFSRAPLDSMDIIYQQMVSSQIGYHYYLALGKSIAETPLSEDLELTYFRAPLITRISHCQNGDEARNVTRFTMPELRSLLLLFDLPVKISTNKGYTLHRKEVLIYLLRPFSRGFTHATMEDDLHSGRSVQNIAGYEWLVHFLDAKYYNLIGPRGLEMWGQ
jgi:hypothetical protein